MDEVGLGKQLQAARKAGGLTQQDLCHRASLSYSTLAKIERGAIKAPSIFTIQRIASALGISLAELMGDIQPAAPNNKKISKSGIRFVYFDINGCLVRFFHRAFPRLAADTGASADLIESTFWHYNDAVCRGEMGLKEFNRILAKATGQTELDWQPYYMKAIDPIKEMQDVVAWATEHYRVGLLSNIMPGFIDSMKATGIIPNVTYDAVVDSSQVRAIKPEAKIYDIAQSLAKVSPAEILLVDDGRSNLMAAASLGWHVLWFDDYRSGESIERIRKTLEFDA